MNAPKARQKFFDKHVRFRKIYRLSQRSDAIVERPIVETKRKIFEISSDLNNFIVIFSQKSKSGKQKFLKKSGKF